jgi:hypothetical protein
MFRRLVLAGLAIMAAGAVSVAEAQENLVVIGTETLDLSKDGASIDVSKAKGAFRGIRVRSKKNAIDLSRVQVVYGDGSVHNEDRAIDMRQGERSRPIDLKKTDRFINKVNLTNKPGKGSAVVEVLGIQTKEGAKKARAKAADGGDIVAGPTSDEPDTATPGSYDGFDVMFGYQDVGFVVDTDVIKVGGNLGKFGRIRLRVIKNDIHINSVKVTYLDGETQEVAVDADIPANSRTKWLDIKGDRFIKEIRLSYRSKPDFKGQARVEVSGQYASGWLGPNGEGRQYNEGWVLLGAQTADFAGYDTDAITVGKNEGGFKRLRLIVRESPITLTKLQVKFFSGPDEAFKFGRERVEVDKPYGPLEFKAGKAAIKDIKVQYRTRLDLIGKLKAGKSLIDFKPAVVEIWGQH